MAVRLIFRLILFADRWNYWCIRPPRPTATDQNHRLRTLVPERKSVLYGPESDGQLHPELVRPMMEIRAGYH
jgi:hypothetical protein